MSICVLGIVYIIRSYSHKINTIIFPYNIDDVNLSRLTNNKDLIAILDDKFSFVDYVYAIVSNSCI